MTTVPTGFQLLLWYLRTTNASILLMSATCLGGFGENYSGPRCSDEHPLEFSNSKCYLLWFVGASGCRID